MQEFQLTWIKPDMDVCDRNGDKIGSVTRVYRHALVPAGESDTSSPSHDTDLMEVSTGLLGLGKHFYIPLSAVSEVIRDAVFLAMTQDEFEGKGWAIKPTSLDEMH